MLRENYCAKQQRIGQRLTRAMAKAYIGRRELAELTGYCEAQIALWERGRAPLDHLAGEREHPIGHGQAKRLRSLEVDDQFKFGRTLNR